MAVLAAVVMSGTVAHPCGYDGYASIEYMTTFDPLVLGDGTPESLHFDPFHAGWGETCAGCLTKAMVADWQQYFRGAISKADLRAVLFEAKLADLPALTARLTSQAPATARRRLRAGLALIELARSVAPLASLAENPAPLAALRETAMASLKRSAGNPFLSQRAAFQVLRILFYQRDWEQAIGFYDQQAKTLAGPSIDLSWRARHYLAGALRRAKQLAQANLELARIHTGYPPLAGVAALDFSPMEEADWQESLSLARDVRERTQLWRLVGITRDGLVAIQEILKLDPRSDLVALLMVRELARAESILELSWAETKDPREVARQTKMLATLEQLAETIANTPGADRPWLMQLIAGHLAARRGSVAEARTHLQAALTARPDDPRVADQAKASLAIALAHSWKIDRQHEEELGHAMLGIGRSFGRREAVEREVRATLAKAYAAAGNLVEAEYLVPCAVEFEFRITNDPARWPKVSFIRAMLQRADRTTSEFDKFVLGGSLSRAQVEHELPLRYLVDGNFTAADRALRESHAGTTPLGTDPFTDRIVDCHDCDHERYASAPWTLASMVARLVELERVASGRDERAAEAALLIGNAVYNITWYGNARVVLDESRSPTRDTAPAMRWYSRAFGLAKSRELKAKAAFLAAKAELMGMLESQRLEYAGSLPTPKIWYPVLQTFADTRYYREVIGECGNFRAWAQR